jgi:dihydrofolate synthase/folylpolyglutamate synthase
VTDALSYLFGLEQFGIKFGLDNIRALAARLDHPERAFRVAHIAGTNGKGSVTAMVDAALRAAGHHSARYTSPHLIDLAERFVIDGRPVEQAAMVAAIERVHEVADALLREGTLEAPPTFFEATTATAFELFRRAAVEVAVVEVGMGGRLDATNIVAPEVTAITSIGLDHERFLGSSLAEIAGEKAGIIKPGVPVVVGDLQPEALEAIEAAAERCGAELLQSSAADVAGYALGLRGRHQIGNAAVAVRVLDVLRARGLTVPREAVATGLAHVEWPGRLDLRRLPDGREILLDAAHNPAGASALASYLNEEMPARPPLVFAAMRDKAIDEMIRILAPAIERLIITRASNPRSEDPEVLAARAREVAPALPVAVVPTPAAALEAAWRTAPRIVAAGSIFLLGDVLKEIGA